MPWQNRRLPLSWNHVILYNTTFWVVLWLFSIWNNYQWTSSVEGTFTWNIVFAWSFPYYIIMVLLGPLIYFLYRQWSTLGYGKQFLFHLIPAIITGYIHQLGLNVFYVLFNRISLQDESLSFSEKLIARYNIGFAFSTNGFLFYWLAAGMFFLIILYRNYRQQEISNLSLKSDLDQAKLRSLHMQLQPHFLFNTFNTISMMARKNKNAEVIEMIAALSELLRKSLELKDTQMVTIEEELTITEKYLQIQHLRFRDRLNLKIDIPDELKDFKVPCLLFQPIVENAFQHGIEKTSGPVSFSINAQEQMDGIHLTFSNTGLSLDEDFNLDDRKGTGLTNTLDRLFHAYENSYEFLIKNGPNQIGVVVQIRLPKTQDD